MGTYYAAEAESAYVEGALEASGSTVCKVRLTRNMTEAWHVSVDFIVRMYPRPSIFRI
jgi:hypothetical protein